MKLILIAVLCTLVLFGASAQVKGVVFGQETTDKKEPIWGARIKLLNSKRGVMSEEDGTF